MNLQSSCMQEKWFTKSLYCHFIGTIVHFDHMALGAFCNSADLEAQPELETQFYRTQEKATKVDQMRAKNVSLRFE